MTLGERVWVVNEAAETAYSMLAPSAHLDVSQQMEVVVARMEEMNITMKMLMGMKRVLDAGGSGALRLAQVSMVNPLSSACLI